MPLIDETARGVYIIAATPFTDTGALDLPSADRLIESYLEAGVDGITILGVFGEAPKLSNEESLTFAKRVLDRVDGRVPVVVGVSAPGMDVMREFTRTVMDLGAAGAMLAPLTGLKTDDQIYGYYAQATEALGSTPIVLQDYPQTTQVTMAPSLVNRLFRDLPTLKILKHEETPGLKKISLVRADEAAGNRRRVSILVGNGAMHLPLEMHRGADGANTGFAFAEMLVEVVRLFHAGEAERAEDLYDAYLPLVRYENQPGLGLAIRKEVLRRRGLIASAKVRSPGPGLDKHDHAELDRMLARLDRAKRERGF
jgi:4-hydroxy-tetrahydrodipicolinate synthase